LPGLKPLISIVQILACAALIVVVITTQTKSEGLSGTIGGQRSSTFGKAKPGSEERIAEITKWTAIIFLALSAIAGFAR
jgi:protein translocase SecG subunit